MLTKIDFLKLILIIEEDKSTHLNWHRRESNMRRWKLSFIFSVHIYEKGKLNKKFEC